MAHIEKPPHQPHHYTTEQDPNCTRRNKQGGRRRKKEARKTNKKHHTYTNTNKSQPDRNRMKHKELRAFRTPSRFTPPASASLPKQTTELATQMPDRACQSSGCASGSCGRGGGTVKAQTFSHALGTTASPCTCEVKRRRHGTHKHKCRPKKQHKTKQKNTSKMSDTDRQQAWVGALGARPVPSVV